MLAALLRDVREEVLSLLFNRYVFRTHQEIVRLNPRLQGRLRSIFSEWSQVVYAVANTVGVRRLASSTYADNDVNLVRFLDMLIHENPERLWTCFEKHYPDEATKARAAVSNAEGTLAPGWQRSACIRLVGADRKALINAAEKVNKFASKRAAHAVPTTAISTTFSDVDDSIDMLKVLTEKYTLLLACEKLEQLEELHRSGAPTIYEWLAKASNRDLLEEMKNRNLPQGWHSIFMEPWATEEILKLPLGETIPPKQTDEP
jgi:hypothetical protein